MTYIHIKVKTEKKCMYKNLTQCAFLNERMRKDMDQLLN